MIDILWYYIKLAGLLVLAGLAWILREVMWDIICGRFRSMSYFDDDGPFLEEIKDTRKFFVFAFVIIVAIELVIGHRLLEDLL